MRVMALGDPNQRPGPSALSRTLLAPAPEAPWTSGKWCEYFRCNAANLLETPWDEEVRISQTERETIAQSLQGFQLGESSEGKHLIRCAQAYATRSGDRTYVLALRFLIQEEQRHARDLGRFLSMTGIGIMEHTWSDSVFRWLRHRGGLEVSITVLVTAEIIAKLYYAALRGATDSVLLRRLCDQILSDEVEHVRFQAERIALLRSGRPAWLVLAAHAVHRVFFLGTCLVVWWKHGRVLKAGGFGLRRSWQAAWQEMNAALCRMTPWSYRSGSIEAGGQPCGPKKYGAVRSLDRSLDESLIEESGL